MLAVSMTAGLKKLLISCIVLTLFDSSTAFFISMSAVSSLSCCGVDAGAGGAGAGIGLGAGGASMA